MRNELPRPYPKTNGSALIVILIILGLAAALLVSALKSNPQIERDKITADALAKAKDALIGYAATYGDSNDKKVFGHLPCPDLGTGTEGNEASSCSGKNISALGRLPWKTLGLPPLRDSSGECLWYAVSGSFKSNAKPDLLNWDSDGQFQILAEDGTTPLAGTSPTDFDGTHPVAVIFSAGAPLSGQNRTPAASGVSECGGNYTPSNYLDNLASINNAIINATVNAITRFITGKSTHTFNDRLLYITADEIFTKRIEKRKDFPGVYFSDTTNLTPTILNNFALAGSYIDNINQGNQYIGGVSTNPPVYGLLQKTAQCLVKYGKNNSTVADKRLPWAAPLNIADFANDSFDDSPGLLAGRPPFIVDDSAKLTPPNAANSLVTNSNNYRLLTINRCATGWVNVAGTGGDASQDGWWDKWKDHLFYAVADAFKPSSSVAAQTYPCSSGSCLTVDGIGPYAAVLIYAGKKLASPVQSRDTLAQKIVAGNYLEGANAISIAAGTGAAYTKVTSATANDVLVCINQDLTIDPTCANPVTAGCPAGQISWPVGSPNCSATTSAGSNGSTAVLSSTAPGTTGSATAICNVNTWQLSPSPAPTCSLPSTGGGGVYTGIVPPTVSQNPGWTGNTGLNSVTLSDGTIITVTSTSGSTPTIYVSNTGVGAASGSGPKSLDLGNGEQMSFTFTSGQQSLAILVGMLKNNDLGYITFKNNGATVGTATFQGCTSSNTSMYSNIVPAGNPTFNQVILTSGTSNGYYINQVAACATGTCAITGSGATGTTLCSSWASP